MSAEENKALIRHAYEASNQGNMTAFFEPFTPDIVLHLESMTIQGLEAFKQLQAMLLTAFPDFHFTVEDMIAEGDTVAARITASGTHQGEFMGLPPTGKHWTIGEIAFNRIVGGKIVEHWANRDMLGFLQQLGAIPLPEQPGQQVMLSNPSKGAPRLSTEENKALLRRVYEASNQGDFPAFFDLHAPDFVLHRGSMTMQGLEAFKPIQAMFLTAFPDFHFTVEDMIAEGDTVAARITASGTHQGEFMGLPPTGKRWTTTECAIVRVAGGKIAEFWASPDMLGLLQQLGAVPLPGEPG